MGRGLKWLAKTVSLERRARLLAGVVPPEHWFRAAMLMSRWHAFASSTFGGSKRGFTEAYVREHWLIELSRLGPFPVPLRVTGAELLAPSPSDRAGVLMCGTHVPLLRTIVRAAVLTGHPPSLVIAKPDTMMNGKTMYQPTGLEEGVPAAPPGAEGLLKIRTVLRRNGLAACNLEEGLGEPCHPDVLILAGRLGARIVYFSATLAPDGVVDVLFHNAVHPFCDSYEAIEANLKAIRDIETRLLAALEDKPTPPRAESIQANAAADAPFRNRKDRFPVISTTTRKMPEQL